MIMHSLYDAATAAVLAVEPLPPESPPGADYLYKLGRWAVWIFLLGGSVAIAYAGGRFAWEKSTGGETKSPQIVLAALIGGVVSVTSSQILNAFIPSS